jgi:hypothetical protein
MRITFDKRPNRRSVFAESLEQRTLLSSNILSNHGDPGSTGLVSNETVLTPTDVLSTQAASSITTNFGRLFDTTLDGQVYAQPLAVNNVNITRGSSLGIHDVLYVATLHDSLYAVDANTGSILWQDNFTQIANPQVTTINSPVPTTGVTTIPVSALIATLISPELGVLSTPAIDSSTNIIYLLANTQEFRSGSTPATSGDRHFVQRLWALNISSGAVAITPNNPAVEPTSGGMVVGDTIKNDTISGSNYTNYQYVVGPFIKGTGNNSDTFNPNGTVATTNNADGWTINAADNTSVFAGTTPSAQGDIAFNALLQMNRVGVTLVNGEIYLGFASHGDDGPYYGWLLGYTASSLTNNAAFVTVPTFDGVGGSAQFTSVGGLWGSGATITTDGTYLYFAVGNGSFNPATSNFSSTYTSSDNGNTVQLPLDGDYGDSLLKVALDPAATQTNLNLANQRTNPTPTGTYNPDGGYNATGFGLKVVDYFTPSNAFVLNEKDLDLGSTGVLLIPSTGPGSVTAPDGDPMIVIAGKEGRIYLLDADNLGGYNTAYDVSGAPNTTNADPAPFDRVLGEYYYYETESGNSATKANTGVDSFSLPSYFNGDFYIGINSAKEMGFNVTSTTPNFFFTPGPTSSRTGVEPTPNFLTAATFGNRGTSATITANGLSNPVIWNINDDGSTSDALTAYSTSAALLFSSAWKISGQSTATSDTLENGVSGATGPKFGLPTAFNGMIYAGTSGASGSTGLGTITGYGLLSTQLTAANFSAPTALSAAAATSTDIHLTWTTHSPLATEFEIDRSTDGNTWSVLQYVPAAATSYDDIVPAGSSFFYRVRAIAGGNGAISATTFSESAIFTGNDNYYLRVAPGGSSDQLFLSTTDTGAPAFTFAPSTLSTLAINPSSSTDQITVDFTTASPIPTGGASLTGASSPLTIIGAQTANAFTIGSSNLNVGTSTLTYTSFSSITFNGGASNDTLTQSAQPTAAITFNGGAGSDTLIINAGVFTFTGDPQTNTASLTVNDNSSLLFTAATPSSGINVDNLVSLTIGPSALATLGASASSSDRLVLVTGFLSLNSTAKLDEGDNDMIVRNGANTSPSLFTLLQQGSNFASAGYWNGPTGITSSAAAARAPLTALAMEPNTTGATTFDGVTVSSTDYLIKYTFVGDANLNASVDAKDYLAIDNAYNADQAYYAQNPGGNTPPLTGWNNGDFNYDGVINGDDYTLIDNAYNSQSTVPLVSQAQATSFPNPTIPQTIAPNIVTAPAAIAQTDTIAADWPFDSNPLDKRKRSLANEIFAD